MESDLAHKTVGNSGEIRLLCGVRSVRGASLLHPPPCMIRFMALPVEKRRYTVAEYLRLEQDAQEKHEYRDGEILLMAGGSADHSLITANVIGELRNQPKGKPCRVYDSNLRVRISRTVLYTYPDASVICGPRETRDPSGQTLTNPRLIVEVLSDSTEAYDRGEKFDRYRQLDSLEEYVLISQNTSRIEVFLRQAEESWLFSSFSGPAAVAQLRSISASLPLSEVYAGIQFAQVPATA